MQVQVLFFASLVDIVGARRMELDLSAEASVADILNQLESAHPELKPYRSIVLTAVNEEYVDPSHAVSDGDEVALFPPVSGGGVPPAAATPDQQNHFKITQEPIDTKNLARDLLRDQDGAVCVFQGVVRNNSKGKETRYLVYEAYEPMALKKLEEIGLVVQEVWNIGSIGIVHRLGRLEIGETSVAVAVTAPHRREAFDACHYAIDRLKKTVPIWKKEYFEDGEVWVEGQS